MSKPKLTAEEKAEKIARDQLKYATNKLKGLWSFGKLKTYKDLLVNWGISNISSYFPSELNRTLTLQDVKDFLSDRQIELDTFYWLKKNPPILDYEEQVAECLAVVHEVIVDKQAKVIEPVKTEPEEHAIKDYGLPPNPNRKCTLYWFQKKAVAEDLRHILSGQRARYLISATGSGKTFIIGELISQLKQLHWEVGKSYSPWQYVVVTKAPVVEKTKRDFLNYFGLTENDVLVVGYDQLRSIFGKRFVKETIKIVDGEEEIKWEWRPVVNPCFIAWDEAHSLKNEGSTQSKIGQSFNEIPTHTFQYFSSATPGTRVADFKCFCVATRVPYTFGMDVNAPLSNAHWNDFAKNIATNYGRSDTDPLEHSPPAVNRLSNYMSDYITRVKGIKWQFHAINKIEMLKFETEEGRKYYYEAVERFEREKAKIESSDVMTASERRFNILAELTIFLKAAESNPDRIRKIANNMYHDVMEGYAAVASVKYKISVIKIVQELMARGVSRDQISLIWGGAPVANKKQKNKIKLTNNKEALAALEEAGITLESIDLDDVETDEIQTYPPELRLGNQSQKQRQEEIDKFQRGETLYCIYTFRAGGVGLSLHHTDEYTSIKCRRKESGYAIEEDIPSIPTRPRRVYVAPTWSAQELVQGVGRCPRLTSLSDTTQTMYFFAGTYEERQARVVSVKLMSLNKIVRNTEEHWLDLIVGRKNMSADEVESVLKQDIEPAEDEDDDSSSGIQFEDNNEDTYQE